MTPDLVDIVNGGSYDIKFSLDGFKQDPNNPNVLINDDGSETKEIVYHTVEDGGDLVIKKGAYLSRDPAIGTVNSHVIATVAKANQDIILTGVSEYITISSPDSEYEDKAIGIELSSLPVELQNEMDFGPGVEWIWIEPAHNEADIKDAA